MPALDIAIVGCGTGGLAAAAFLARGGHRVTLHERFAEPKPVGAGLMLQPTGLACLARLGLDEEVVGLGRRIDGIHGHTARGRTVIDLAYRELGPRGFGLGIHRGALFAVLLEAAIAAGAAIHTGVEVRGSRLDGGRRHLIDAAAEEYGPFDLVVDASGLRSGLRAVHAEVRLDRPNPYGAVWGVVEEPADWPHRGQLRQCYDGAGIMAGILPIGRQPGDHRQLSALFWSLRVADYPAWRTSDFAAWRERVAGMWPAAGPVVRLLRSADDLALATYADTVLARPHTERLVFIGDAARTASPQLGQGANLALIDAMILAASLEAHATIAVALDAYARSRLAHTRFYGLASRWLTPFFQSDSLAAGMLRDLAFGPMRHVPYARAEMTRTLAGVKTGLFTSLDPGDWHERYRLGGG